VQSPASPREGTSSGDATHPRWARLLVAGVPAAAVALATLGLGHAGAVGTAPRAGATSPAEMRGGCPSGAEVEEAVSGNYAYAEWMSCNAIALSRSTNGGRTFGSAIVLPGSQPSDCTSKGCGVISWDPAIAVSRTGTLYAAFMHSANAGHGISPVVDVSTNHGASFAASDSHVLPEPAGVGNFGDRDFITVSPNGDLFVTWDYGPSAAEVHVQCPAGGSCSFSSGDFNAVVQRSTNGGRTWTNVHPISTGFPAGGALAAPVVAQPNGTLDALYLAFPTNRTTLALTPAGNEWFTRSTNDGASWTRPVEVGAGAGTVSTSEWWIDDAISTDPAGNLYATWDTQTASSDVAWLSYSTSGGTSWSRPIRVSSPTGDVEVLTESAGVGRGIADVGWQTPTSQGYATYVRPYSISRGWLTPSALRVSAGIFGRKGVWPGDTFGIEALPNRTVGPHGKPVLMTWGSAAGTSPTSHIYSSIASP